ncbi:peptidylprolyl isomerase [Sedimentibacter saalensis]|uniref:Peptidyl-prolyl cis-trans isomerase n=1 Tax=Sedimentibacter saalensis TaxID=130788 RepID=A0A562J848_9FIRM|nr:peptidylprolyl isomerase [Sedimentibacter saalensis]TWH79319.1 peptidyl-prolyl cis-trans isomerase B (cyclophilin B) [Sedimentibacter saalensis]
MKLPIVTFEFENGDVIKAELHPEIAPVTVNNFISLINKSFYDGKIFHRVIEGFMIQGGCPNGNGMGGPGYTIKGEFTGNGFKNDLKHDAGVLSMARAMNPNSAGSQFFIMHKKSPHLDGQYAAFGKVIEGMDVVNKIAQTKTDRMDRPAQEVKLKQVTVDTFGETYPEPEKSN